MDYLYEHQAALLRGSVVETLRIARCFLSQPGIWTIGAFARDAAGNKVKPNSPKACQFSLHGAIAVSCNKRGIIPPFIIKLLDDIVQEWNLGERASDYNDERPIEMVLALLDAAITRSVGQSPVPNDGHYHLGAWEPTTVIRGIG